MKQESVDQRNLFLLRRPASWCGEQWREALPLGNGLTGLLIPGSVAKERMTFNRHDLWSGSKAEQDIPDVTDVFQNMRRLIDKGAYARANCENIGTALDERGYACPLDTPAPLGSFTLEFVPDGPFRHYRRGIDLATAESFVDFEIGGVSYHRRAFVSRKDDLTVFHMSADRAFRTVYDFRLFGEAGESRQSDRTLERRAADGDRAVRVVFLGDVSTKETKEGGLEVCGKEYTILVRCASHGPLVSTEAFEQESYASLLQAHTEIYKPLFASLQIELSAAELQVHTNEALLDAAYDDEASPALLERMWRFGRYLFISASSESGNPVPLYGLWHGGAGLQWSQFVANENVEMTYWHALPGGLSYAVLPLLHYYTRKVESFRACAKKLFGMRGIWISAYTTPGAAGVTVPVSVIVNWISCAGWLCRHFWDYYLYTRDEQLLRSEILPFMYEAALFYADYVTEENGRLRIYPSVSPENAPANLKKDPDTVTWTGSGCPAVQNATMDFAIMKELLTNLLDGIKRTGMYKEEAETFRALLGKIPSYQLNGDGAVKEWMHEDLVDNYAHRHLSHIYPVFPGNEVTAQSDPKLFEAFRRALELRQLGSSCGWSLAHMANIYARFGEGERAAACLDVMMKSVVLPNFFTLHNDWRNMGMTLDWESVPVQLDAVFGAVSAVQEMLFRWDGEALSILPALPERLKNGSVRGASFPGGSADFLWDENGNVKLTITAERDIELDVLFRNQGKGHYRLLQGEQAVIR